MDEFERSDRKREARHRQRLLRQRKGELQGRVIAGSLVCFALLWAVVFVQMATGNDPVLSRVRPGHHSRRALAAAQPKAKPETEGGPEREEGAVAPEEEAATAEVAPEEATPEEAAPEAAAPETEAAPPAEEAAPVAPEPEPVVTGQS